MRKNQRDKDMDEDLDKFDAELEAGEDMDFEDEMDMMDRKEKTDLWSRANQRRNENRER
jgi:hypothetical protein